MSLDKAVKHGKERRKPHTGGKLIANNSLLIHAGITAVVRGAKATAYTSTSAANPYQTITSLTLKSRT